MKNKFNKILYFFKNISISLKILYILLFLGVFIGMFFYCNYATLRCYKEITLISFIYIIAIIFAYWRVKQITHIFFTIVIVVYTIFTQFGLCFTYYLVTTDIINNYGFETKSFLFSNFYPQILGLAIIAICMMVLSALVCSILGKHRMKKVNHINLENKIIENKIAVLFSIILLCVPILYYLYYLLSGTIYFGMDYTDYRASGIISNFYYEFVIVGYYIGICYIFACAKGKSFICGISLFFISAVIMLLFGNRGEVLFPALACLGIIVYRYNNISYKLIFLGLIIVLVLIPMVKVFRHLGNGNILELYLKATPLSGLAEMGVSMRLTNYMITEISDGTRNFLNGFSYYNPFINILDHFVPFDIRLNAPASFNFRNEFYLLKAMTPVAESYANFGVIGVFLYHSFVGGIIGFFEGKKPKKIELGLLSTICVILIYSTRNVFSGVPAEIFVCIVFYLFVKYTAIICKKIALLKNRRL